jgi:hypothetical protein
MKGNIFSTEKSELKNNPDSEKLKRAEVKGKTK